ncbi:MAG: right-handed parallel beta-helix repeat-containing protein [Pseudomonadota bacterium]
MMRLTRLFALSAVVLLFSSDTLWAQDTAFTYQGQLRQTGLPFTGTADLEFRLYDQLTDGTQISAVQSLLGVPVQDGLFQVQLDFGASAFDGSARFLEVTVDGNALAPRQPISATPLAQVASGVVSGSVDSAAVDSGQIQLRVSGTCPAGSSIQAIGEDGTVTCQPDMDTNTDEQILTLNGSNLEISNGNAVDLSVLFNNSDVDPTNELNMSAALNGTTLSITDPGGDISVDLAPLSDTPAEALAKLITVDGDGSSLDADLLDGLNAADIISAASVGTRTEINSLPFTISAPGSYVVTQSLTNASSFDDGITISASNVTLDLGGFTLSGSAVPFAIPSISDDPDGATGRNGDDGIVVSQNAQGIRIFNGHVISWAGDGINALRASNSIFEDLVVTNNGGDGLVADFSAIIMGSTAFFNALDGLEADDGSVIVNSTARQNGDNGIQTSEGSVVVASSAFNNWSDGIDVGAGSVVSQSTSSDNRIFGFDIALGGTVQGSAAYDNNRTGFDIASASLVKNNIAALNGSCQVFVGVIGCPDNNGDGNPGPEHGFRTFANSWIIDNQAHENDGDGIRISSTDALVKGNHVTDNDTVGIRVTSSGTLIINNYATGNVVNYAIDGASAFGPIVNVLNAGDLSLITNADHPLANIEY